MNKKDLYQIIEDWIEKKGTRSFYWLYKKIEKDNILLNLLNKNCNIDINYPIQQKIYHFYNDIKKIPKCRNCNKELNFITFVKPYQEFCDRSCSIEFFKNMDYTKINEKRKNTMNRRYGVNTPMESIKIKDKYIKNSQEKYGVDWVSKSIKVREKISDTWQNKKNKKNINKKRYKNLKFSLNEKYGDNINSIFAIQKYQDLRKCTLKKNYGVNVPFKSEKIKNKYKETCMERYGYPNAMQSDEIQKKWFLATTKLKDYKLPSGKIIKVQGYNNYALDILLKKYDEKDLTIEFDCPKIKYKLNNSNHYYRPDIYIKSLNKIIEVKSIYTFLIDLEKNIEKYKSSIALGYKFEFWIYTYQKDLLIFNFKKTKISIFLENSGINDYIYGSEFIYIPWMNYIIRIELMENDTQRNYIKELKYNLSLSNNNNIIMHNIFKDLVDKKFEIIQSRLLNKFGKSKRLFARKCNVRYIDGKTAKKFLNRTHIQGYINTNINIGLFSENKLVSVMSFGKRRAALGQKHKIGEYELLRLASELNYTIVGGAGKLLSFFIKEYKPNLILSYADKNWSNGNVYEKLGFKKISETTPNYWYYKDGMRYHRYNFRKNKLIEMGYNKNKTEKEIMKDLHYKRIYDCGNIKYEYIVNKSKN